MGLKTGNPLWQDSPSTSTPINAAALNKIEDAIDDLSVNGGGGGGAVSSVNGKTGTVVLSANDVGAVPSVNGKTGVVTLSASDVGALPASSFVGNTVTIIGADKPRNNPLNGSALPPGTVVFWVASTIPPAMAEGDQLIIPTS